MTKRLVQVSRNGKIIGRYPPEQLAALMDTGHFLETDQCSSEALPGWTPMLEFLQLTAAPKYSMGRAERPRTDGSIRTSSHQGRHRSKQSPIVALSGWIAFLLSVGLVVGAGFWIVDLQSEIGRRGLQITELTKELKEKDKEIQRLMFASREVAEAGVVRGSAILRNDMGKRVALPGLQVLLFSRKAIEAYLDTRQSVIAALPAGTPVDLVQFFSSEMPAPISSTTADASGRFEFAIPDNAEYVLFARSAGMLQGQQSGKLWFVAFNAADPLNTLVQIQESNSVQQFVPSLMITYGR